MFKFFKKKIETSKQCFLFSLPKEIFHNHICLYLRRSEKLRIRISCKYARNELFVSPFWELWLPIDEYDDYVKNCIFLGWKNIEVYGFYFIPTLPRYYGHFSDRDFSKIQEQISKRPKAKGFDLSRYGVSLKKIPIFPDSVEKVYLSNFVSAKVVLNYIRTNPKVILYLGTINVLCWAAYSKELDSFTVMETVLQQKRKEDLVNESSSSGYTPLFIACQENAAEKVKLLIKHGADVNCYNSPMKVTALMISVIKHKSEIIPILLEHEANPFLPNNRGETVLDYVTTKYTHLKYLFLEYLDK